MKVVAAGTKALLAQTNEEMLAPSWALVTPVIDPKVIALCVHPYPGHPKGCPNFGKKNGCPPGIKRFDQEFDVTAPVWAVWNKFNLAAHVEKMRAAHPSWSWRQLVNCLYWQPSARNKLRSVIREFARTHHGQGLRLCASPEAQSVDLTATMASAGIALEWPPLTTTYQIVLMARAGGETTRQDVTT